MVFLLETNKATTSGWELSKAGPPANGSGAGPHRFSRVVRCVRSFHWCKVTACA